MGQEIPEFMWMGNAQSINIVLHSITDYHNHLQSLNLFFSASEFPKVPQPPQEGETQMDELVSPVSSPLLLVGVGNAQTTGFMALKIKPLHPIQLPITHMQQKNITNSLILLRVHCISISMPKSGARQSFMHPASQNTPSTLLLTQKRRNERLGEYSNLSWRVSDPEVFLYHEHMDLAADQPMKEEWEN